MVGWKAAHAAWIIAQHADQDPAFQKQALAFMEKEAQENGAPLDIDIAYLSDRIATAEKRPQLYGTQFTMPPAGKLNQSVNVLQTCVLRRERRHAQRLADSGMSI